MMINTLMVYEKSWSLMHDIVIGLLINKIEFGVNIHAI